MANKKQDRNNRIDKKHRFPLRVDEVTHSEYKALSFKHNTSLNLLYMEALKYCLDSQGFHARIDEKYKPDERRGHYVFHVDEKTVRRGREI